MKGKYEAVLWPTKYLLTKWFIGILGIFNNTAKE